MAGTLTLDARTETERWIIDQCSEICVCVCVVCVCVCVCVCVWKGCRVRVEVYSL